MNNKGKRVKQEVVYDYVPTLLHQAVARAKKRQLTLRADTLDFLRALLTDRVSEEDLFRFALPPELALSEDERKQLHSAGRLPRPKQVDFRLRHSVKNIRNVAGHNVTAMVDSMSDLYELFEQDPDPSRHLALNPPPDQRILTPGYLATCLSWLCPWWPFC